MRRFVFLSFLVGCVSGLLNAQQLPQFRYQDFNSIFLNPAYAAKSSVPDVFLNHRNQWVGFSGAPTISSIQGKYAFRDDMAAGASFTNDLTGPTTRNFINLNYAYLLKTESFNISFGLAWIFAHYKVRGDLMTLHEQNDHSVIQNINDVAWKPDANIGFLLFSDKFYAGFSVQQVLKSKFRFYEAGSDYGVIQSARHFFINGGVHLKSNYEEHMFTPHLNLYMGKAMPFSFDLGVNYMYKETILMSMIVSGGNAVALQAGYRYKQFVFSYAFDIVVSRLRNVSSGSHEITIAAYLKNETTGKTTVPSF